MERLGRYPLSVILSFLSETEGTSLLITKRRFAYQLLPIFRLQDEFAGLSVRGAKQRHRFVVAPVQDAVILLDRLNTKRLYRRRKSKMHGYTTSELARRESEDVDGQYAPELELLRFLDRHSPFRERGITIIASYPRSGNTLVRSLLERTTGIVTGSDTRPDRSLSRELAEEHNLVGEGVTSSVAFVKTHWPERIGSVPVQGERVILVVRNPYDAIDSYWNMMATKSHTKSVTSEVYERFRDKFNGLVENEIHVWLKFHRYWLQEVAVATLLVRFEDLVAGPSTELRRILKFTLGGDSLPEYWEQRITQVARDSVESLGSYAPRTAPTGVKARGKSIRKGHFSRDQLVMMHQAAAMFGEHNYLRRFGYDVLNDGFPSVMPDVAALPSRSHGSSIILNKGSPVRPTCCPYGRAMTRWRHSVTNNDVNPLPTNSR